MWASSGADEQPLRWKRPRLAAIVSAILSLAVGCGGGPPDWRTAPDLQFVDVSGARRSLEEFEGSVVLLSFLDLRASGAHDPSKSQTVFLRSMARQYGSQGLSVVVVASVRDARSTDAARLLNLIHDWELGEVVLLRDEHSRARSAYGVRRQPTTFLIDSQRFVRWQREGFAPAQELATAIESVLSDRASTKARKAS